MGKNLNPHAGMSFLRVELELAGVGMERHYPTGLYPLPSILSWCSTLQIRHILHHRFWLSISDGTAYVRLEIHAMCHSFGDKDLWRIDNALW
jgi:hypothetical protein